VEVRLLSGAFRSPCKPLGASFHVRGGAPLVGGLADTHRPLRGVSEAPTDNRHVHMFLPCMADLCSSGRLRPVPGDPHRQHQQRDCGGDREQQEERIDAVAYLDILPVEDLGDGEDELCEDDRRPA